jgi:hypothetical protein
MPGWPVLAGGQDNEGNAGHNDRHGEKCPACDVLASLPADGDRI